MTQHKRFRLFFIYELNELIRLIKRFPGRTLILAFLTVGLASCNGCPGPLYEGGGDVRSYSPGAFDDSIYERPTVAATVSDPRTGNIYVGGRFSSFDAATAQNIAVYEPDEEIWSALDGDGLKDSNSLGVKTLAVSGNYLYVGGQFTETQNGGVVNLNNIARYDMDTKQWSSLAGNGLDGVVESLAISGNDLFVGGQFSQTANGATTNLNRIARYNLATNTWSALAGNGLDDNFGGGGVVRALAVSGGNLFVGGSFSKTRNGATTNLNNIALYNIAANSWSPLAGNGLTDAANPFGTGEVLALLVSDNNLFAKFIQQYHQIWYFGSNEDCILCFAYLS